jgi:hypothetical protein
MTRSSCAIALVIVVLVAGCGSGSKTASSTSSATPAKPAASASLATYLVRAGEETGFSPEGAPTLATSPAAWDKGEAGEAAETRRLTGEGFRAAQTVHTTGSNRAGVSFVMELATPSAAQHEVAVRFKQGVAEQHPSSQFTIATIPDSHGWEGSGNGKVDTNVLFSEGSCVLLVGAQVPSGTDPKPPMIAGALKVYGRTAHSNGVCNRAPA